MFYYGKHLKKSQNCDGNCAKHNDELLAARYADPTGSNLREIVRRFLAVTGYVLQLALLRQIKNRAPG